MGVLKDIFGKIKGIAQYVRTKELGKYTATFQSFDGSIYEHEIVRACIRPLAEHSSKATVKCSDKRIERLLNISPNQYMNGKDFLYKVRTMLEVKNTAFIFIQRDELNRVIGFYPVPYNYFEIVEAGTEFYVKFYFLGEATRSTVIPWRDLAVVRKDYFMSDFSGENNDIVIHALDLIETSNQGISHAIKSTANLRGVLKSTKGMLAAEDLKKQKEDFVRDYMSIDNEGGIASLDATQEFTPIKMEPTVVNSAQMKEFRETIYRYYNISEAIVTSNYTESQMEAFYEARIEPFLVALSLELTRKIFSQKELGHGNMVIYEANKLQFSTMATKISVFKEVVLYGGMTINEWRLGCNMAPLPGGDVPIRRLDASTVDPVNENVKEEDKTDEQS